jgi:hypothetical protein
MLILDSVGAAYGGSCIAVASVEVTNDTGSTTASSTRELFVAVAVAAVALLFLLVFVSLWFVELSEDVEATEEEDDIDNDGSHIALEGMPSSCC